MWIALALAVQTAAAAVPDVQLEARVTARRVEIRSSGEASLEARGSPDGGSDVRVDRNLPRDGRRTLRNVDIRVRAEARIAPPQQPPPQEPQTDD